MQFKNAAKQAGREVVVRRDDRRDGQRPPNEDFFPASQQHFENLSLNGSLKIHPPSQGKKIKRVSPAAVDRNKNATVLTEPWRKMPPQQRSATRTGAQLHSKSKNAT